MISIGEVELGDYMLAYDEATGETGYYPVTAVWSHEDEVTINLVIDDETIETTPEHPFYTDDEEWIPAGELTVGDEIYQSDGSTGTVESVVFIVDSQEMYNLTVDEAHTYFVGEGQWLVHNRCPIIAKPWEAMGTTARTKNPRTNLEEVWPMPWPQRRGRLGLGKKIWEAHHIVAQDIPDAAESLAYINSMGIKTHSPANLVWLPGTQTDLNIVREYYGVPPLSHRGSGIHTYVNPPIGLDISNVENINNIMIDLETGGATTEDIVEELYLIANQYLLGIFP